MTFSILFWNIWLNNQIKGKAAAEPLLSKLHEITDKYQPDLLGLTEVLQNKQSNRPFVTEYLEKQCGYTHSYYAPASPLNDDWLIGTGLYSKKAFDDVKSIIICKDSPAEKRGYSGYNVEAITSTVLFDTDKKVNFLVAHPLHLRAYSLRDHYNATAKLEELVRSESFSSNSVLGGDFNEPGFMPKAFKNNTKDFLNFRTGSSTMPTWRHNAYPFTLIRANLDQLYWSRQSSFELIDFKVIDTSVSDHRPIIGTFEFT